MSQTHPSRSTPDTAKRRAVLAGTIAAVILTSSGPVSAHTDFSFSTPADGDVVAEPVTDVTVAFTNPAMPAGEGFEVLDPDGTFVEPTSIDETDGTSFVLTFEPPLAGGTYGVRWQVRAGDAHPINGSFSFTVTAAALPDTAMPDSPLTDTDATAMPVAGAAADAEPTPTLAEFLAGGDDDGGAGRAGWAGRFLSTSSLMVALGAVIALAWVIEGRRDEISDVLAWSRLAGFGIATGGLIEFAALEADPRAEMLDVAGTQAGVAALLKVAGGLVIVFGLREHAGQISAPARSLSAATQTVASRRVDGEAHDAVHRWTPTSSTTLLVVGLVTVLVSFWFDGHTVTRGPRIVHSLSNLVHLSAASAWAGGVIVLAALLARRHHDGAASGAATLVVRFSAVATVALIAVAAAGAVMAFFVLDSPADLTASDWGRALLIKNAAVAVAATLGAYNHFRLRPALAASPRSEQLSSEFRRTLYVEAAVFTGVLAATAWLVATAT